MREIVVGEERNWALATYGLLLIAPGSGGVTALIGVVLAHLRLDVARGGLYESHYRNQILTFWVWMAVALVMLAFAFSSFAGFALWLLDVPAWRHPAFHWLVVVALWGLIWGLASIWYYWRLLRGLLRLLDDKPC
jgi:uncharacterized membrane protein